MKRVLFCLMLCGSYPNIVLCGQLQTHQLTSWQKLMHLARILVPVEKDFFISLLPSPQVKTQKVHPDQLDQHAQMLEARERTNQVKTEKVPYPDQADQHDQTLEARERTKRALLASKHKGSHLPKKNKWVCQQPRSKNH